MAEKEYTKTTWVNNSEPDIDAEHLNNIEDGISGLYAPEFDDSGIVPGITSFPTFLVTMTKKMNPIAFYKNLKAGLKFVLHTGQLVNNGLCNEPGKYPLDAAFGKELQDQIYTQNSNLGDVTPKQLLTLGAFLGTITRNSSSIIGNLINVSLTITSPMAGISNDTAFFYINKSILPVVTPILLGSLKSGYIFSSVNDVGDTMFSARVDGGIPANTEIYLNFNCFTVK